MTPNRDASSLQFWESGGLVAPGCRATPLLRGLNQVVDLVGDDPVEPFNLNMSLSKGRNGEISSASKACL